MKFLWSVVAFFTCSVWAQTAEEQAAQDALAQLQQALPACAVQCLVQTVPTSGCALTDTECICTSQELAASSTACLGANCTVIETLQTKNFQDQMCGIAERSRQDETMRVCWALWALALIAVIGRFAARSPALNGAGYGWDDWTALVVMGFVTAIAGVAHVMITDGLGKDIWTLQPWQISSVLRYFWLEEILYSFAVCLTKVSICLLYLRIFPTTVSRVFRNINYVVIAVLFGQLIGFSVSAAFQCTPVSYMWNQWDGQHEGTCIDAFAQIYAGSGTNILMDLIVFVLPIPRLLQVQISLRKKFGICATFLVGLFVTLCSIIRLYYVVHWGATTNPTWTYTPIALWSLIEVDIGIICACMPALSGPLKKFWKATVGKTIDSLTGKSKAKSSGYGTSGTNSKSGTGASKTTASGGGGGGGSAWRSMKRSGNDSKVGKDSIMCNVSLNVSDEMELVDKRAGAQEMGTGGEGHRQRQYEGEAPGIDLHDYRQKW